MLCKITIVGLIVAWFVVGYDAMGENNQMRGKHDAHKGNDSSSSRSKHSHKMNAGDMADFVLDFHIGNTDAFLFWRVDWYAQALNFSILFEHEIPDLFILGFSDHGILTDGLDFCAGNFTYQNKRPLKNVLRDGYVEYINGSTEIGYDMHNDCIFEDLISHDNGSITLTFHRKFVTCDSRDIAFEPGTVNMFLFIDPQLYDYKLENMSYQLRSAVLIRHEKIGIKPLIADPTTKPGDDQWYLDLLMDNARVSDQLTTYWCKTFKLEEYYRKNLSYVLQSEILLGNVTKHLVHHALIYLCQTDIEYNGNCFAEGKNPTILKTCNKAISGWAMGLGPITFPPNTGLPIGGPRLSSYILVEIHYHNIDLVSGYMDNSGFRLLMTKVPQKYDVGILEVGLTLSDANSIPPLQKEWPMTGYCTSECTQNFPPEGITVFGSLLHSHLTGRRIYTSHYRNGVKIGEINRDNHFHTLWQHFHSFENYVKVLPGDILSTSCVYDTRHKSEWTLGGFSTEDEMCLNILLYYPATAVAQCQSAVDNSTLHQFFENNGITEMHMSISEKYKKLSWDQRKLNALQELYHVGPLNVNCMNQMGELIEEKTGKGWENIPRPESLGGAYERVRSRDECLAMNDY